MLTLALEGKLYFRKKIINYFHKMTFNANEQNSEDNGVLPGKASRGGFSVSWKL